jgi:hypothetical protein
MRARILILIGLMASVAWGQQPAARNPQPSDSHQMQDMDMSNMKDMSSGSAQDKNKDQGSDPAMAAMHSMEGHMDMGPHMKMTDLRPARPGDTERAQHVVEVARTVAQKYLDYRSALADGFTIFHPEVPQKIYHFVRREYAREAALHFNPEHPTALLYEKHDDTYKLVGLMYTAPRSYTEDQLDERIPLSIAQWHEHVNFCAPPAGHGKELLDPHSQFGLSGSIVTQEACDAAGGTFHPVIFNWMVHVYPFEKDQASIWSVERQHDAD